MSTFVGGNKRGIPPKVGTGMAIDSTTQVNASVILDKSIYEQLKSIAKANKRSISGQIAYWIGLKVEEENKPK